MNEHHRISYIELGVTDLAETRNFYETAFGWEFNEYGPSYCGIRSSDGDGEIGGLDAGSAPRDGGPLILIFSNDLEASVEAVENVGGTLAVPPYAYPGGRRFEFLDPSGNRLGVFSNE